MTRIDFYTLEAGRGDRFQFACQLIEKIRAQGLRALVHCPDAAQARALDRLLWTFREGSFLPHGLVGEVDVELTPVLISPDGQPAQEHQVLLNLALDVPEFFARFQRVCELIDQTPEVLAAGRRRWAWYKQQSCQLEHHRIGRSPDTPLGAQGEGG
ncbi:MULTISPECIES: DNA polymerase III subunit chi [Thiorhodovibrio]|uniref:DNA polymerase III subunit chi n=1 Tax=Thiorhodovibrio TaxID=61593 RepID=UPI001914A2E6|nr:MULTISPECIES: DNA polymerase III subunit chi [Thiorhodovibrio]MBK5968248.1 DNA polymerase III subunit chi [Thiorhodovibrio winogradskyi]WPL14802.1 DNA polymerase III subunit chi [Thiorhodovibrio litoralis]